MMNVEEFMSEMQLQTATQEYGIAITKTLSPKGTVVIPKEIRDILGIQNAAKIVFRYRDGAVLLEKPQKTLDDILGSLELKQNVSFEQALDDARDDASNQLAKDCLDG